MCFSQFRSNVPKFCEISANCEYQIVKQKAQHLLGFLCLSRSVSI